MNFSFEDFRPTHAVIHIDHLRENFRYLRSLSPETFFCPMVKANAYGHGDIEVARVLENLGTPHLGVALIEEGLRLRGMGIKADILFFGLMDKLGARACLEADLTPVLNNWEQIHLLQSVLAGKTLKVHLKFDTGMHRLGFETNEALMLQDFFQKTPDFRLEGIMTHLHSGEDAGNFQGHSFQQLRDLQKVAGFFEEWHPQIHSLNSAGLLNFINHRASGSHEVSGVFLNHGARPGLALFGYSPLEESGIVAELKPVMSLRSKIVSLKKLAPGQGVSYGHSWTSSRPSWVGTIPIGYADGIHRVLSNQAEVLIEGRRVPVIGHVTMDYLMVDLTELVGASGAEAFLWKDVTLFGYDSKGNLLSAKELAVKARTIPWEILTAVGERVPRILQGS